MEHRGNYNARAPPPTPVRDSTRVPRIALRMSGTC
jgi:hypothetical protein